MGAIDVLDIAETDAKERLDKIKSLGYWRVNIRPIGFDEHKIGSLERCWDIMESCYVSLRVWDYPVVNEKEKIFGDDWIQSGSDFMGMVELWRFYRSGQFIHYFSCLEDYRQEIIDNAVPRLLGIVSTLYRITEIYEFAANLGMKKLFDNGVQISIKLEGMKGRLLYERDRQRVWNYASEQDKIAVESRMSFMEFIASVNDEAINKTIEILSKFGFNPSRIILLSGQQRLLEKRL